MSLIDNLIQGLTILKRHGAEKVGFNDECCIVTIKGLIISNTELNNLKQIGWSFLYKNDCLYFYDS